MFDVPLFLANLALGVLAIAAARFVRPGRREATWLAALMLGNFVFCAMAYTPYAPKYALAALGVDVSSKDLWMIADATLGAAALLAFNRWWGWAVWAVASTQVAVHLVYKVSPFDPVAYSDRLGLLLHGQQAVFLLAGGPGGFDFLRCFIARFGRSGVGSAQTVSVTPADTNRGQP